MQLKVIKMISIRNSSKTVSFPYLLSFLDNFINVNALKTSTPLTLQDALSTHRNITRTIRTYHYDHWSTIDSYWWLKRRMQAKEGSCATKNRKRLKREHKLNLCERRKWLVQFEELAERINPTVLVLQSDDQRDGNL